MVGGQRKRDGHQRLGPGQLAVTFGQGPSHLRMAKNPYKAK